MRAPLKTKQFLILYTVALLVVLGIYGFSIMHINGKKVVAADALSETASLHKQNSQLRDLNHVVREINEDQDKLNSYFVHDDKIINFLEAIESVGRDSGAEIKVRSLNEEETDNPEIKILTLNLTAKGDWESVYHFLVLIESFPVKSTFDKIHLSGVESEVTDEEGNVTGTAVVWSGVFNMKVLELVE